MRVTNSRSTSLIVAVLQEAFLFTLAFGLTLESKCQSASMVLPIVNTSFSAILTWMHGAQHVQGDFHEALCGITVHST